GLRTRAAGPGYAVRDRGNVRVADRDEGATRSFREVDKRELAKMGGKQAHHVEEIIRVAEELAGVVADIERSGAVTLVLGGDHSMSMGTLAGIARGGRRPGSLVLAGDRTRFGDPDRARRAASVLPARPRGRIRRRHCRDPGA